MSKIFFIVLCLTFSMNSSVDFAVGRFTNGTRDIDGNMYYQFISYDNEVWWVLTEDQIGYIPSTEKNYYLVYSNNGTTAENKTCDCLKEWDCECEVYDDVFLAIYQDDN